MIKKVKIAILITLMGCQQGKKPKYSRPHVPAILASRFLDYEHFNQKVEIKYDSTDHSRRAVLTYVHGGDSIISVLESGITQGDIVKIRDTTLLGKALLALKYPNVIANRRDLNRIYKLSRRLEALFGQGDKAFYDLALSSVSKIRRFKESCITRRDSSEKGFINTFNHVTAQTIITAIYSENIADFIADVHERHHMPELIHGKFEKEQLEDSNNNPIDNYVDILNNELGQELGLYLKEKYGINENTNWNNNLFCRFMNEIQAYYQYSLGAEMAPFKPDEKVIGEFVRKIKISKGKLTYHVF